MYIYICWMPTDSYDCNVCPTGLLFDVHKHVMQLMVLSRYATRAEGQCKAGQVLGSGECFWKFHGVQRTINATCLQQGLQANVVAQNKACWDKLPDGGKNVSAVPWSECFLSTLTGKAIGQHGTPSPKGAMSREEIVAPFDAAFERPTGKGASNQGRCPDWHPSM